MRQIVKQPFDHGVHLQIIENDAVLVEDMFPSIPAAKEFSVKQLNEKLVEKKLSPLSESEISTVNQLVA
jgi:hypothetical protein